MRHSIHNMPTCITHRDNGNTLSMDADVEEGSYIIGPVAGTTPFIPNAPDLAMSDRSDDSVSSWSIWAASWSARVHEAVVSRDGSCAVTGWPAGNSRVAHFVSWQKSDVRIICIGVPSAKADVLAQVYDMALVNPGSVRSAVMLSPDLQQSFDTCQFSFLPLRIEGRVGVRAALFVWFVLPP